MVLYSSVEVIRAYFRHTFEAPQLRHESSISGLHNPPIYLTTRVVSIDICRSLAIEEIHLLAADVSLLDESGTVSWIQKGGHTGIDWLHEFIRGFG